MEVQSEIYDEDGLIRSCPLDKENSLLILQFVENNPEEEDVEVKEDSDGDLLVKRKKYNVIEVECSRSTPLGLVGLQLWRGAFLLSDYILSDPAKFSGKVVLEIGSGIGLTSIVAGMFAKEVICTDIDKGGILNLIRNNAERNKGLMKSDLSVLPLDFYSETFSKELSDKLKTIDIILAADVIYDNDLTEAFIKTLIKLLDSPGKKIFYLALEKRYVFTMADLDTVAPCYEHFLSIFMRKSRRPPMAAWRVRQCPIDFKQSFKYERTNHLVMWEIVT